MLKRISMSLHHVIWVHPEHVPQVSIEVFKAPAEHEAQVLGIIEATSSERECFLCESGDLFCRFTRQGKDGFGGVPRGNLFINETLKLVMFKQHHEDVVTDDHARGLLIGELRVERKSKFAEEGNGFL